MGTGGLAYSANRVGRVVCAVMKARTANRLAVWGYLFIIVPLAVAGAVILLLSIYSIAERGM